MRKYKLRVVLIEVDPDYLPSGAAMVFSVETQILPDTAEQTKALVGFAMDAYREQLLERLDLFSGVGGERK